MPQLLLIETAPDTRTMFAKLPPACFIRSLLSGNGQVCRIDRGAPGWTVVDTHLPPDRLNDALPVRPTPAQIDAMRVGAMFGWDALDADLEAAIDSEREP